VNYINHTALSQVRNTDFLIFYTEMSIRDIVNHPEPASNSRRNDPDGGRSIPAWVDWLIGVGIALLGIVLAGIGAVLSTAVTARKPTALAVGGSA
jgi:hypothetical protein